MNRRIQVLVAVVIVAALVAVYAYSAGWLAKTSTAEIRCYVINHQEDAELNYVIEEGSSFKDFVFEDWGPVEPGETVEVMITHEWDGTGPARVCLGITLSLESNHYVDSAELEVIPGGTYHCRIHVYAQGGASEEVGGFMANVLTEWPTFREPFSPYYSGAIDLSLYNADEDDMKNFLVDVNGDFRVSAVIGPQMSLNVSIPVGWDYGLTHDAYLTVTAYDPADIDTTSVRAELVPLENNTATPVSITA